jgi:broad specificity phosphatase PhoE
MKKKAPMLVLVRHGHSRANAEDRIVSSLENGVKEEWGLTALGREQAAGVFKALREQGHVPSDPSTGFAIISSPFSRALETAQQIADSLAADGHHDVEIRTDEALRERYFGVGLEGASSDAYREVWAQDARDVSVGPGGGGESVLDVAGRCEAFVDGVRRSETADVVFLVSHGDTLSILATHVGRRGNLSGHRAQGLDNCGFLVLDS